MSDQNDIFAEVITIITIIIAVPLALFFLVSGIANLIHPTVPDNYIERNTTVCTMIIISSLIILYAMFRPFIGGILLVIFSVAFFIIVPDNPLVFPIILIGVFSLLHGFLSKQKLLKEKDGK